MLRRFSPWSRSAPTARCTGKASAGQLANQQEMLEQVQLGSLDMVIASSETSSAVPEFGIFDLPFLFRDRAAVKAALEGPLCAELARLAEKKNLILLGTGKMVSAR